jgi:hypothetical protein
MDNLRPQDETYGGQRVFSCERCGEEFPSRDELKTVSLHPPKSGLKLTFSTTRAHSLMELERSSRLISLLSLPLDHGPRPSSTWAVSIPISNYLPSGCQAKIAKRPWFLSNPTTRMNLLPQRQSPCTSTRISTLTVPKDLCARSDHHCFSKPRRQGSYRAIIQFWIRRRTHHASSLGHVG